MAKRIKLKADDRKTKLKLLFSAATQGNKEQIDRIVDTDSDWKLSFIDEGQRGLRGHSEANEVATTTTGRPWSGCSSNADCGGGIFGCKCTNCLYNGYQFNDHQYYGNDQRANKYCSWSWGCECDTKVSGARACVCAVPLHACAGDVCAAAPRGVSLIYLMLATIDNSSSLTVSCVARVCCTPSTPICAKAVEKEQSRHVARVRRQNEEQAQYAAAVKRRGYRKKDLKADQKFTTMKPYVSNLFDLIGSLLFGRSLSSTIS